MATPMNPTAVEGNPTTAVPAVTAADAPRWNVGPLVFLGGLWAWVILALFGYWRDFEQYSYGYFVPPLMAYFISRRLGLFASDHPSATLPEFKAPLALAAVLAGAAILPLEYLRLALPASRTPVWVIALVGIFYSLVFAYRIGGGKLVRSMAFPLFFFLTAAPWFSFLEKGVTLHLMEYVAIIVTEILHLCGIQATARGTLITMAPGVLGIAEACSGIRSLQSGLMYAFAVGELFLLSGGRRILLVVLTVATGFLLNLARTFILAYQTDLHGTQIIDKIHDQVGIVTSLVLPVAVWGFGKLLAGVEPFPARDAESPALWLRRRVAPLSKFTAPVAVGLAAFLPCHVWLLMQDATVAKQTTPYFIPRMADVRNATNQPPADVWKVLEASSGGYFTRTDEALPKGQASGFFLFYEPRKDNYNVTWHHPERCMVGAGWRANGPAQEIIVNMNGQPVKWLAFPWKNDRTLAVQVWGAWRNGAPIVGNKAARTLPEMLKQLKLFSKGQSATEIISITIPYSGDTPPVEAAQAALPLVFDYKAPAPTAP
jgi:exosortase